MPKNIDENTKPKKAALITGGAKGIGYAIAIKLASQGWNLVLCGRDEKALEVAKSQLEKNYGIQTECIAVDLATSGSIETLFASWKHQPNFLPQALICNAGNYGTLGPLIETDFQTWKKSFDLNFFSIAEMIQKYVLLAKQCDLGFKNSPLFPRRKIIVMSGSGLGSSKIWPFISAYSCAKAALYRLTEVLNEEIFEYGIDINCLAPGAVKTGITDQVAMAGEAKLGQLFHNSLQVQKTGGDPPELAAEMAASLLSSNCDGLSGRLFSAKWDRKILQSPSIICENPDLLRLRRIDNELFKKS